MSDKRVLIFDFGGVLMKTVDYGPRHAWDDRLGLSHGSTERVVHGSESWRQAQHGYISVDAYWDDVARQLRLETAALHQLQHDYFKGDQLDRMLIDYIRGLREAGFTVALLSNDSVALRDKLRGLGIHDLFDPLVISAEIGVMKPASAAYQTVLDRIGCVPGDAIFIDDLRANIAAAEALGIIGLRYTPDMDLPAALAPLLHRMER